MSSNHRRRSHSGFAAGSFSDALQRQLARQTAGVISAPALFLVLFCVIALKPPPTCAGDQLGSALRLQLDRAGLLQVTALREHLARGKLAEAVAVAQHVLDSDASGFMPNGSDRGTCHAAASETARRIAELSDEGLGLYERQFGARAAEAFDRVRTARDIGGLIAIVRRFGNTRAGLAALQLLSATYFDRGQNELAAIACRAVKKHRRADSKVQAAADVRLKALASRRNRTAATSSDTSPTARNKYVTPQLDRLPTLQATWNHSTRRSDALAIATDAELDYARRHGITTLPISIPCAVKDLVVTRTRDRLMAIQQSSGDVVWSISPAGPTRASQNRKKLRLSDASPTAVRVAGAAQAQIDSVTGRVATDGARIYAIQGEGGLNLQRRQQGGVFVAETDNELIAFDALTGKEAWRMSATVLTRSNTPDSSRKASARNNRAASTSNASSTFGPSRFLGVPLPIDDRLYLIARVEDGIHLVCLRAIDGTLDWSLTLAKTAIATAGIDSMARRFACPLALHDGLLICPTASGGVVAVELLTRSLRWAYRYDREDGIGISPDRSPNREEPDTERWWRTWRDVSSVMSGDRVFLASPESNWIHALDIVTGQLVWSRHRDGGLYLAGCWKQQLVVANKTGAMGLDAETGHPVWNRVLGSPSGRGVLTNNEFIVPLVDGRVAAIDLADGAASWSSPLDGTPLGNLTLVESGFVSQTISTCSLHKSLRVRRRALTQQREHQPDSALLRWQQARLDYESGRFSDAFDGFSGLMKEATAAMESKITPELVRHGMVRTLCELLKTENEQVELFTRQMESFDTSRDDQIAWFSALEIAARQQGEFSHALDACLNLRLIGGTDMIHLDHALPSRSVRIDHWTQSEIRSLLGRSSEKRAVLERKLRDFESRHPERVSLLDQPGKTDWTIDNPVPLAQWARGRPVVTTTENEELDFDVHFYRVTVPSRRDMLFDHIGVAVQRMFQKVRFAGAGRTGYWEVDLPSSNSPHRHREELCRAWAVDNVLVLRIGTELFAIRVDRGASGEFSGRLLWSLNTFREPSELVIEHRETSRLFSPFRTVVRDRYDQRVADVGPVRSSYLCFQKDDQWVAVETRTGHVVWRRANFRRDTVAIGDDDVVILLGTVDSRIEVLDATDGRTIRIGQRQWAIDDVLLTRGTTCVVETRPKDASRRYTIRKIDLADDRTIWSRDFDNGAIPCALDQETFGVLGPTGRFVMISRQTGETLAELTLPMPDRLDHIWTLRDHDRYFILLSEQVTDPAKLQVKQLRGGYRAPWIRGSLFALDRFDGTLQWSIPIKDVPFTLDQAIESPFLILNYHDSLLGPFGKAMMTGMLRCFDKNSGQEVYKRGANYNAVYCTPVVNPIERRVDLKFMSQTVHFRFER